MKHEPEQAITFHVDTPKKPERDGSHIYDVTAKYRHGHSETVQTRIPAESSEVYIKLAIDNAIWRLKRIAEKRGR